MAEFKNDDLLLVNRADVAYKVPGEALYATYLDKPEIGNLSLVESNPGVDPRFTNQDFVTTVTMAEEGQPLSEKTIDAFVEGTILENFQFVEPLESSNSVDGIWTAESPAFTNIFYAITYGVPSTGALAGTGVFVAPGYESTNGNELMYSVDGASWTRVVLPGSGNAISAITYGDGKFVAMSNNDGTIFVATDVENWTEVSGPNATYTDVTYGNNLFVAVATNTAAGISQVSTSPDGYNWTNVDINKIPRPDPTNGYNWFGVTYGNGKFVAVCNNYLEGVMTSSNGTEWTMRQDCAPTEVNYWASVVYANDIFVAVATYANTEAAIMYSNDAITWKRAESPSGTDNSWSAVTYGDGRFVAVGNSGVYNSMYSYDGINWRAAPGAEDNYWEDVAYGNGRFVAVSRDGNRRTMWSYTGTGSITSELKFAAATDMTTLAAGDAVNQTSATGIVFGINNTTVEVESSTGTWVDNEDVTGPSRYLPVDSTKKYLKFNSTGVVETLLDTPQSPPYVTTDENPVLTLKFPATFPSGFTPDEELGEGTTLTVEATATNVVGSDGPKSDTVQPEFDPPIDNSYLTGLVTLYSGTNGNRSIVNGVDLVNNDGLVWLKKRTGSADHFLYDTKRGPLETLYSNDTNESYTINDTLTAFNNNGFDLGTQLATNIANSDFVAWTFASLAGYFDIVEWTGQGTGNQQISHNLGTKPGFIITKNITASKDWYCYHSGCTSANSTYIVLNETAVPVTVDPNIAEWNVTNSSFEAAESFSNNLLGNNYIGYLFAEDTPNVIKCGNATGSGRQLTGFKTQFVLIKPINETGKWIMMDDKRTDRLLYSDSSEAEESGGSWALNDDGFTISSAYSASTEWIYVAIAAPPLARSLTAEELEAQKLKFLTYSNRKEVVCGEQATAARAALQATLLEAGYDAVDIAQAYSNLDN